MNVHSIGDLRQMQALPLQTKIVMSKERIRKWYEYFGGDVCVSFSGGKDSTVLLHLVRSMFPDVEAVYADTGLEYPEVRSFAMKQPNVTVVKPKMNFKQVIMKYGYPLPTKEIANTIDYARKGSEWALRKVNGDLGWPVSKRWLKLIDAPFNVSAQCCYVMKKRPIIDFQKRSGKSPYVGTLACESKLREEKWKMFGCSIFEGSKRKSAPLSFWTENDVLQYIKEFNLEISSVYGDIIETGNMTKNQITPVPELKTTGCDRTGCMFCMFGCHLEKEPNRFQRMKETHPKQYEWCMKPVSAGGLGLDEVLKYAEIPH